MTRSSVLAAFAQSPSNAYDMASARCDSALTAGSGALSTSFWISSRALVVEPSESRRDASRRLSARGVRGPPRCASAIRGAARRRRNAAASANRDRERGSVVIMRTPSETVDRDRRIVECLPYSALRQLVRFRVLHSENTRKAFLAPRVDHAIQHLRPVRRIDERDVVAVLGERSRKRRSEEHTSELQSRQYLVCRLLL